MKKLLKIGIIATVCALCLTLMLMVFSFDVDQELAKAENFFLHDQYEEANRVLVHLKSSLAPMQFYLYKGYIDRALNHQPLAVEDLKIAEKDGEEHANFSLLLEILLNQLLNAEEMQDQEAYDVALKKAMKYGGPDNEWVMLFNGLQEYREKDFIKALALWRSDAIAAPLSPWMKKAFEKKFTRYWIVVHKSRALIEARKSAEARVMIEQQIPLSTKQQMDDLLFLMGYSYAKEAQHIPLEEAYPHYELAQSYFNKIPFTSEHYKEGRNQLAQQIAVQIENIIQLGNYKDLIFLLNLLDQWQETDDIIKTKEKLITLFNRSISLDSYSQAMEIYQILRIILPEGAQRQALEKKLNNHFSQTNLQKLDQYARTGKLFIEEETRSSGQEELNPHLFDPAEELLPIQGLINAAINDKKINSQFHIERSTDLQKALALLKNFVKTRSGVSKAFIMLGQVYYLLGDFTNSAKSYHIAIELDPRNYATYQYLALVYEAVHQAQDATILLLQALKYAPKNPDIWEQLAALYLLTGNELDALPSYKEALYLDPSRYHLYLELGRLESKLEMPEDASQTLLNYLEHDPESKEALQLLLLALYNPLISSLSPRNKLDINQQREEIYKRLYKIAPEEAEKIRRGYKAPSPVVSPPPEPEPNLPFLPQ